MSREVSKHWQLETWARWVAGVASPLLIAMAIALLLCQFPTTSEWNGNGEVVKQIRSVGDLTTAATACLVGAAALLVYALNGVRLVRVGLGSMVAEGGSAGESAARYYSQPPTDSVEIITAEGDPPEPTEAPAKQLTAEDDEVAVFELVDVPIQVVVDALRQWPGGAGRRPGTLADFQFAARKRGKGNHPWTLKFRDCTPVKVSYGGRGKADSTVAKADQQGAEADEAQPL